MFLVCFLTNTGFKTEINLLTIMSTKSLGSGVLTDGRAENKRYKSQVNQGRCNKIQNHLGLIPERACVCI